MTRIHQPTTPRTQTPTNTHTPSTTTGPAADSPAAPGAPGAVSVMTLPQDAYQAGPAPTQTARPTSPPGAPAAPASALSDQLAAQRATTHARGISPRAGGQEAAPAEDISPAQAAAAAAAQRPVDWEHPEQTLDQMSQVHADGTGQTECGAAAVVGGAVLQGPDGAAHARDQLFRRTETLSRDPDPDVRARAAEARETLEGLPPDPQSWTHGDVERLQHGTYQVGRAQQLQDGGLRPDGQLTTTDVRSLRDLTWQGQPRYGIEQPHGRTRRVPVDVHWRGEGHFVLAQGRAGRRDPHADGARVRELYDPWPQADGTAYSQAADGGREMRRVLTSERDAQAHAGDAGSAADVDRFDPERTGLVNEVRRQATDALQDLEDVHIDLPPMTPGAPD